jgi:hypothetical protein
MFDHQDDHALWLVDAIDDDPAELASIIPDIKRRTSRAPPDEDLGFRHLLERPERKARARRQFTQGRRKWR